ncbi:MAG TPA: aminoacetone oxidase family FAD-binding enzyme [Anaerovoracaceae bacterium]|nr:aminoacetone oxidase family FAD-binding enzyme [Anaerovoracaceae bacterium]
MYKKYDICIIGGGASGMTAAIKAKRENPDLSLVILEKNNLLGKKLKATGNGRCNMTNIDALNYLENLKFFSNLGFVSAVEDNRVYPYSFDSGDIVNLLKDKIVDLNIDIETNASVNDIYKKGDSFYIIYGQKTLLAKKLLISCGGKAAPEFGTTGDGYRFAKEFGHKVTSLAPILVPVECKGEFKHLKGVRAKGYLSLLNKDIKTFSEYGELQFTDYGVSGICVFNATRFMKFDENKSLNNYMIYFDFAPNVDIFDYLANKIEEALKYNSKEKCKNILRSVVKEKLSNEIIKKAGIKNEKLLKDLTESEIKMINRLLHSYPIKPMKLKGWKLAQCTSGGVDLNEINCLTMESLLCSGLYFSGEVIDYDGPCGGYNLDNSWFTGIKAGESMANSL